MRRRIHVIGGGGYMSYEEEDTWKAAYTPLSPPLTPYQKKKRIYKHGKQHTPPSPHPSPPTPTPHLGVGRDLINSEGGAPVNPRLEDTRGLVQFHVHHVPVKQRYFFSKKGSHHPLLPDLSLSHCLSFASPRPWEVTSPWKVTSPEEVTSRQHS
jgi:hypothetical protein